MANGATPLMIAAEYGHGAVVELLLEVGAEVDKPNCNQSTPLGMAHQWPLCCDWAEAGCITQRQVVENTTNVGGSKGAQGSSCPASSCNDIVARLINFNG